MITGRTEHAGHEFEFYCSDDDREIVNGDLWAGYDTFDPETWRLIARDYGSWKKERLVDRWFDYWPVVRD